MNESRKYKVYVENFEGAHLIAMFKSYDKAVSFINKKGATTKESGRSGVEVWVNEADEENCFVLTWSFE